MGPRTDLSAGSCSNSRIPSQTCMQSNEIIVHRAQKKKERLVQTDETKEVNRHHVHVSSQSQNTKKTVILVSHFILT